MCTNFEYEDSGLVKEKAQRFVSTTKTKISDYTILKALNDEAEPEEYLDKEK